MIATGFRRQIEGRGLHDPFVLDALRRTSREAFAPKIVAERTPNGVRALSAEASKHGSKDRLCRTRNGKPRSPP